MKKKMLKKELGVTLVALVVTVIVLLTLSGIVLSLVIGQGGIINIAQQAGKNHIYAEQQEKNELEKLYSSMMVATNDDSKITISMEDLTTLIDTKVEQKIKTMNVGSVPAGTVISYMGNNVPGGYLSCDGTVYNISEYKNLADQIKTEFGSYNFFGGDGTTTFAVPNLQGEFLRGYSAGASVSKTIGVTTEKVGVHQEATQHNFETRAQSK